MKKRLLILLVVLLWAPMVFGLPGVKQWTFDWDDNDEEDLDGYYLYWGSTSGGYNNTDRIWTGVSELSSLGVPNDSYVSITARDFSMNESGYSAEIFFDKDQLSPAAPDGLILLEK